MSGCRARQGGAGDPVLLLLHGLGATAEVWSGFEAVAAETWPGRWIAPDLPGHGGSARLGRYSFGHLAAAVAEIIPATDRLVLLGHSLGGVVALTLAGGLFGVQPAGAIGLGIKVRWTEEELARARALSARPNQAYSTRKEAAERHLKVAGLSGLVTADAVPDAALVESAGTWSLAFDPAAFAVGAPEMIGLLGAARCPVTLAAGALDPMSPADELRLLVADPVILPGLSHNAHVERPAAVAELLPAWPG